ncbi:MAG TPA: branched-chain amino acid ABC transporter permease [Actinomycetota bacterium]
MDAVFNGLLAGIAEGAAFGLVALGIVLVYKATRVLNFAQGEIATLCLYIAWELTELSVPVFLAAAVALLLAAALGAATELLLRPLASAPRLTVTVATLGIATVLGSTQLLWFQTNGRALPAFLAGEAIQIGQISFKWTQVLALIVSIGLGLALFAFFKRTLFGLGVLAAAQDQTALRLQGVPFSQVSIFTWSSGAILTTLAGLILIPGIGPFFPFEMTRAFLIPSLAAALVGGLTSLPGAFVGGLVIGIAKNLTVFNWQASGAEFMTIFVVMVLVLLFRPQGLLGEEA